MKKEIKATTETGTLRLVVIDERCQCSGLKSDHLGVLHNGGMDDLRFGCERFTFKSFIYEDAPRKKSGQKKKTVSAAAQKRERAAAFAYQAGATAKANEQSMLMGMDDRSDIAGYYGYQDWNAMSDDLKKEARTKFKEGWAAEKKLEDSGWQPGDD